MLDLTQLAKVLAEIESPPVVSARAAPLESGWGDLTDILSEIRDDTMLKNKMKEILRWINDHPDHTYPQKVKGWINTIRSQFCTKDNPIAAAVVVDHMVRLGILNVIGCNKRVRRKIIYASRVQLNRKRCHDDVVNEEFDELEEKKRQKLNKLNSRRGPTDR